MKSWMRCWLLLSLVFVQYAANAESLDEYGLWSLKQESSSEQIIAAEKNTKSSKHYIEGIQLELDANKMRAILAEDLSAKPAAKDNSASSNIITTKKITIPLPNGLFTTLELLPDLVLSGRLAEKYPDIQTFKIIANDSVFSGKVNITPSGFNAMLQMLDGEIIFIDPVNVADNLYVSYKKSAQEQISDRAFSCGVTEHQNHFTEGSIKLANKLHSSTLVSAQMAAKTTQSLLHYRIAIATSGEYAVKHGGTKKSVMSAITTTISRVNQILERDLGIHLDIVENNDLLINLDANTDSFTKNDIMELLGQNQHFIDSEIGTENYDIGHLFTASGGGMAAIASVCNQYRKAQGISGTSNPVNDSFDIDFVAHEIGHQLGATHTFNSSQGLCSGSTRSAKTAFEPGSGSSIMSYAGYCGIDNLQSRADAMYHIGSIKQIYDFTNNDRGNRCGTRKSFNNQPPIARAGKDFTIPSRTPFELNGEAHDSDGDPLIYAWEQIDSGESSLEYHDKGDNALFRVHLPNNNKIRTFPPMQDILSNSTSRGEKLPELERQLNFSFVAQDGVNVAQSDEMKINVTRTGSRFALHLPKSQYTISESYQVLWNVAGTNKPPINCQNVDLFLSTDGGSNFTTALERNLPNTGSAWTMIPATSQKTSRGRFKLKCSDNVFFALSYRDFVITDKEAQVTFQHNDEDQPEANLKDRDLDLIAASNENDASTPEIANVTSQGSAGGFFNTWLILLSGLLLLLRSTLVLESRLFFKND